MLSKARFILLGLSLSLVNLTLFADQTFTCPATASVSLVSDDWMGYISESGGPVNSVGITGLTNNNDHLIGFAGMDLDASDDGRRITLYCYYQGNKNLQTVKTPEQEVDVTNPSTCQVTGPGCHSNNPQQCQVICPSSTHKKNLKFIT